MKPKLYVNHVAITAMGVAHAIHQLSTDSLIRSSSTQKASTRDSVSPYPGICLNSGSELLDSGFDNAEVLRGKED
jgi:hypothetical protein